MANLLKAQHQVAGVWDEVSLLAFCCPRSGGRVDSTPAAGSSSETALLHGVWRAEQAGKTSWQPHEGQSGNDHNSDLGQE
jgi:hypothetical protein